MLVHFLLCQTDFTEHLCISAFGVFPASGLPKVLIQSHILPALLLANMNVPGVIDAHLKAMNRNVDREGHRAKSLRFNTPDTLHSHRPLLFGFNISP